MFFPVCVCSCSWTPCRASKRLEYCYAAVFSDLHLVQHYSYAHNMVLKDRAHDTPSDAQSGTLAGTVTAKGGRVGRRMPREISDLTAEL